jgi:hypothetical protein
MKEKLKLHCLMLVLLSLPAAARAQGTAFTYQGRLEDGGLPASGTYDLTFSLFDSESPTNQIGNTVTNTAVAVSNGLFVVTLDFAGAFAGAPRWLEIGVGTNGAGSFTTLSPLQEITAAPYAIFAGMATSAATVAAGAVAPLQLSTPVAPSDGQVLAFTAGSLSWIDPAVAVGSIWSLNGANAYYNAGPVGIGTNSPLPGYLLDVGGPTLLRTGGNGGGFISFHTPNAETGMTINGGIGRADLRFDGSTLKLLAGPGPGPPSAAGGIAISSVDGGVGVGILPNPGSGIRLDVNGQAILRTGGNGGGIVQFGSPNSETGMTINGNNRADLRFNGATLKLVAGPGNSIPSAANGIAINTAGNVGIGTDTPVAKLDVRGVTRTCVLTITGGCDLAEPFLMNTTEVPKGSVVVIDEEHPGQLRLSTQAYDTRVAGIISGGNGVQTGISLHQEGTFDQGQNVALTGRVYVQADTTMGAIKPGDLLTTSDTPGHAMKVADHGRAQGAILGKAMSGLAKGQGMVLVLVTLQ